MAVGGASGQLSDGANARLNERRYEPWAKGCLWAYAEPAGGPPDGWDFRPECTTWDAYSYKPTPVDCARLVGQVPQRGNAD